MDQIQQNGTIKRLEALLASARARAAAGQQALLAEENWVSESNVSLLTPGTNVTFATAEPFVAVDPANAAKISVQVNGTLAAVDTAATLEIVKNGSALSGAPFGAVTSSHVGATFFWSAVFIDPAGGAASNTYGVKVTSASTITVGAFFACITVEEKPQQE